MGPRVSTTDTLTVQGINPIVHREGEGPTLVYLHSAGGIQPNDPVIGGLARHFSVVAPLAPGFHDLEELVEIRDVHDLALYYDDLFEALGLDGVPVIGHSFGGMVAAELAAHVPHRVSKLVLVAPVGLWNEAYPMADLFGTPLTEIGDLMWGDPEGPMAQMTKAAMEGMDLENMETVVEQLVPMVQGMAAVAKFIWPLPDKGLDRRLHRVTAQTLIIWGALDRLVPAQYADDFARLLPGARVEKLEGAGHMVPLERLDDVVALVRDFVSA